MIIFWNKPNRYHVTEQKILDSGANEVDYDWWQIMKKHPSIIKKLESGLLEEMTEGKSRDEDILSLKELKQPIAKDLVQKTIDLVLLKEWLKAEHRPVIKGALKRQIELIEAPIVPSDGNKVKGITTGQSHHVEVSVQPNSSDI